MDGLGDCLECLKDFVTSGFKAKILPLPFAEGYLGRNALSKLIHLNYQVRMGMMAAGAYGLPQFRMRAFFWGARPNQKLPQYPLPTHDLVLRDVIPVEFEMSTVGWEEGKKIELEKKLLLEDAISDLPSVGNYEDKDVMDYDNDPKTEFQRFIRLIREEMPGFSSLNAKPQTFALRSSSTSTQHR